MQWWCVYEENSGRAISFTTIEPRSLRLGLSMVVIPGQPDDTSIWDPATQTIIARPEDTSVNDFLDNVMSDFPDATTTKEKDDFRAALRQRIVNEEVRV